MQLSTFNDEQYDTTNLSPMSAQRSGVPPSPKRRYVGLLAIGFAGVLIASLLVVQAVQALPLGKHGGHNSHGYLGINIRDVSDEQMMALKIKGARGAEIVLVDHDGPASRSGLREHDVILQVDGKAIESEAELRRLLKDMPAGRTVTFLINRDGQQQTISTQLANRDTVGEEAWERHMTVPEPAASSSWHGNALFGATAPSHDDLPPRSATLDSSYTGALLEMMGPQLADYFGASNGLLVRAVDPNSPAFLAGMRAGDVVLKINAIPVVNSGIWLKTIHENRGKPLAIEVLRDRKEQTLTLTPDSKRRSSVIPHLWPGAKIRTELTVGMLHRSLATE